MSQAPEQHDERAAAGNRRGDAGTEAGRGEPPAADAAPGDAHRQRLDTIEWADDRTQALDPHTGLDETPIDDLLGGGESQATYREQARHVTPTLGPASDSELDR